MLTHFAITDRPRLVPTPAQPALAYLKLEIDIFPLPKNAPMFILICGQRLGPRVNAPRHFDCTDRRFSAVSDET